MPRRDPGQDGSCFEPRTCHLVEEKLPITVSAQAGVSTLAGLVHKLPFLIVADLVELWTFATVTQRVGFEKTARIAPKLGGEN